MVNLVIDDKSVNIREGTTIYQAAEEAGIYIPTLCYHPTLRPDDSCGLCLVEADGRQDLVLSCVTQVDEGMVIRTDTLIVRAKQREVLLGILSTHPNACLTCWRRERCQPYHICLRNVSVTARCVACPRHGTCELEAVVDFFGVEEEELPEGYRNLPVDTENPLFSRDYNFCIGCSRCVRMCEEVRGIGAIKMTEKDGKRIPEPANGISLIDSGCRYCSACVEVCPTRALMDKAAEWEPQLEREAVVVPCHYACPAGIDVPLYVYLAGEGKYADSLAVVREKVPFPGVLGRVCIHPCEEACRRGVVNEAISIKFLKRFVADRDQGEWKKSSKMLPKTGKKVAIVGSGPAGLTAGYYLAKSGHQVTVFEELPQAGGMMRVGIPDYRLPKDVLDAEIEEIAEVGVEIKLNTRVESVDELFQQGYEAVFVALGAHGGMKMGVEGEDSPGVVDGASFLRKVALGEEVEPGNKVAVIGGGNVAIDSARIALRLGVKEVKIIYRRSRAEMPASEEEILGALEEGVEITYLAAPLKISHNGRRLELTCNRMRLGEPDASGRRRPEPIKGGEFTLEFDSIIAAIGQRPDIPTEFDLKTGRGNTIGVSLMQATGREGVWAGGDVATGPASVIEAIAAGRRAAGSIDKYLGGEGDIEEELTQERLYGMCVGSVDKFAYLHQVEMPCLAVEERQGNFVEVELGFDEETALREARRCFQCGVRLQIPSAPRPPSKARRVLRVSEEAKVGV